MRLYKPGGLTNLHFHSLATLQRLTHSIEDDTIILLGMNEASVGNILTYKD